MKHYVTTVSHRGPDYPLDANRRRLALLKGITVPTLRAQGTDWTWLVYVNPADPLLDERMDAFRSAGVPVIPIIDPAAAIDWSGPVLTTRIDDDDGFAPDAFARLHKVIPKLTERTALMFPCGFRVYRGRFDTVANARNAWVSIYAPKGDRAHVRMQQHRRIARLAPIRNVDTDPGWLWVRHQDTDSAIRHARRRITNELRSRFPVDWSLVE